MPNLEVPSVCSTTVGEYCKLFNIAQSNEEVMKENDVVIGDVKSGRTHRRQS
jgi:hypothetical protein